MCEDSSQEVEQGRDGMREEDNFVGKGLQDNVEAWFWQDMCRVDWHEWLAAAGGEWGEKQDKVMANDEGSLVFLDSVTEDVGGVSG